MQFEAINLNSGDSRYVREPSKSIVTGELPTCGAHIRGATCKYANFSAKVREKKGKQLPLEQ